MIKISSFIKIILLVMVFTFTGCSTVNSKSNTVNTVLLNSNDFRYQERFEDYLASWNQIRPFKIENETHDPILLETKEDLGDFVTLLISNKYPKSKFTEIYVSEDKTKKIWFAYTCIENSLMRNNMMIIICKENCKVFLLGMDK